MKINQADHLYKLKPLFLFYQRLNLDRLMFGIFQNQYRAIIVSANAQKLEDLEISILYKHSKNEYLFFV